MKLNKEILALAIPNIISNISVPLISSVDTALMGGISSLHLGAIGVGAMLFNFIYWNFGFLRMGTTGLSSQAYGAKNDAESIHVLGRALLLALVFGSIIVLLQEPLRWLGFRLMNVSDIQYNLVAEYFYIRIWAAPISLALITMIGWFFGMQNAIFPLLLTMLINVTNIVLSYVLVVNYGMGAAGVAYGTVAAQTVGLLAAILLFMLRYRSYLSGFNPRKYLAKKAFLRFLQINTDIFLRTVCLTIAFGFFASQSAAAGAELLAINIIFLQFVNWLSFGVDGLAYAAESLVGKYKGAKQQIIVYKLVGRVLYWGFGLGLLYALVYAVGGAFIFGIFSDDKALLAAAKPYLWLMVVLSLVSTPSYIWDGIFVGLTATKSMRNSMLVALLAYFGVYYFCVCMGLGVANSLWSALIVFLLIRGVLQYFLFRRYGVDLK